MDSTRVTSRSNSDIVAVRMIAEDTSLTAEQRMTLIADIARAWDETAGQSATIHRVRRHTTLLAYWKQRAARPLAA